MKNGAYLSQPGISGTGQPLQDQSRKKEHSFFVLRLQGLAGLGEASHEREVRASPVCHPRVLLDLEGPLVEKVAQLP